jgi:hypothetical protein
MVNKYLIIVRLFIPSKKRLDIIIIIINTLMIIYLVRFQSQSYPSTPLLTPKDHFN